MNGWWLPPADGPRTVQMRWTAQSPVTFGLAVSAVAVLVCIGLALRVRRRRRPVLRLPVAAPRIDAAVLSPASWRASALTAAAAVVVAALVASPASAAVAVVPAVLVLITRRPRIAAAAAAVLFALLAAMAVRRQLGLRFMADAAWPGRFEHLHRPGMLVVALLLAGALVAEGRDQAG
jgi:hypothetical protein